jgi:hypothetical protein
MGSLRRKKQRTLRPELAGLAALFWALPVSIQPEHAPNGPELRSPAGLADTLDDTRRGCIREIIRVGERRDSSRPRRLVVTLPGDTQEVEISFPSGEEPEFPLVGADCISALDQAASDCLSEEAQRLRSGSTFPFAPSSPTTYCDVRPTGREGCSNVRLVSSGEVIVRVDARTAPIELQSVLAFFQNPAPSNEAFDDHIQTQYDRDPRPNWSRERLLTERRNFARQEIVRRLQEFRQRYRFYVTPASGRTSGRFRVQSRNTSGRAGTLYRDLGAITHIRLAPYAGSATWRQMEPERAGPTILARARDELLSTRPLGFLGLDARETAIVRDLQQRARHLSEYWLNGMRLLDHDRVPRLDLSAFQVRDHLANLGWTAQTLSTRESRRFREAIRILTHSIIEEASLAMEGGTSIENILTAASYWWSARGLQIGVGCAQIEPTAPVLMQSLVQAQYEHQQCRRLFASRAYAGLNRTVSGGDPLRITSPEWVLTFALGSRMERAQLFERALPILLSQLERDHYPTRQELSVLVQEVLQSREELRLQQGLIWNGLQPLSDAQTTAIRQFLAAARGFFQNLAAASNRYRLRQPELYADARRSWEWVRVALELGNFPAPSDGEGTQSREVQDALQSLQRLPAQSAPNLQRALLAADRLMSAASPTIAMQVCRGWLEWLSRNPQAAQLEWSERATPCGNFVNLWLARAPGRRLSNWTNLPGSCFEEGNPLACHALLVQDSMPRWSPSQWAQLFENSAPNQTSQLRAWIRLFREAARTGMGARASPQSREWRNAIARVHQLLRSRAEPIWNTAPAERELSNCFDAVEWERHRLWDEVPDASVVRSAIHPDCREPEVFVHFWIETLRQCDAIRVGERRVSWFAPVETFHFWLRSWNGHFEALPRDRLRIRDGLGTQLFFALNDMLDDPNDRRRFDSMPRHVSIYCPVSRSQASLGYRYAERVNRIFNETASFFRWRRIGYGNDPASPFWEDESDPLLH